MAATEAQKRAVKTYSEKLDQIAIRVQKGKRNEYKAFAESQGKSLAGLIVDLIEREMSTKKEEGA